MGKTIILDSGFYHVYNKSIENYQIFETDHLKQRFYLTLSYYNSKTLRQRFSAYMRNPANPPLPPLVSYDDNRIVKILAFCIMPNHYHLLIKTPDLKALSSYIQNTENSFTRYFNLISKRKGPLWQSRYHHVPIITNAQLLHVSRYIHLNPTSSSLVENPEDWNFSSYRDYIKTDSLLKARWNDLTFSSPYKYKKFHDDRKDYQRKLKQIKNHLF